MRKLVLSLVFLTIDHLEEARGSGKKFKLKEYLMVLWSSRIKEFPIPKIYLPEGRDSFEKTEIVGG